MTGKPMKQEFKIFAWLAAIFVAVYFLPVGTPRFDKAVFEALELTKWYAREHVILCLLPAFWIAGAIAAFFSKESVMKYLGPGAPKVASYGVAAVSGTILAVCSCTVLPLFSGIYRMGAGLGPATAFLYSGPAINALAIILTAKILGWEIGLARAVGAVAFALMIGALMAWIFRKDDQEMKRKAAVLPPSDEVRPLWQTASFFAVLVGILVFANWGSDKGSGFFAAVYAVKWPVTAGLALVLAVMLRVWNKLPAWRVAGVAGLTAVVGIAFPGHPAAAVLAATLGLAWLTAGRPDASGEWFSESWSNAKQIMPLLLAGVFAAGFMLGRPGHEGVVPSEWIANLVGGNSLGANFFASLSGAFMYFATLTEVPIVQGLLGSGMGKGPALALLLAGPALSLPSMLVISSIIGPRKTTVYVTLVVLMATFTGWLYGMIV
jgi:uncharacterized membrane protein YraQ (UPF0718 family)